MSAQAALVEKLVRGSAQALIAASGELCALDSIAGDGDHGLAMATASKGILARLDTEQPQTFRQACSMIGTEFSKVGGSMGALLYVAFDALSAEIDHAQCLTPPSALATLLATAQNALSEFGGAKPGDKTLVDAVDAARVAAGAVTSRNETPAQTLRRVADATKAGAVATAQMSAKVGRASRLGELGRGSADAGATSFAIIMDAVATAYQSWSEAA